MKLATIINLILGQIGFILLVSDSFPGRQGPVTFFFFECCPVCHCPRVLQHITAGYISLPFGLLVGFHFEVFVRVEGEEGLLGGEVGFGWPQNSPNGEMTGQVGQGYRWPWNNRALPYTNRLANPVPASASRRLSLVPQKKQKNTSSKFALKPRSRHRKRAESRHGVHDVCVKKCTKQTK